VHETGSVGCPACGSLRSVGIDERTEHTDLPVEFDLTPVRNAIDDVSADELADRARERSKEHVHRRGFINGGDLRDLDDTYLAATELLYVADAVRREFDLGEREELYFLSLLRGADAGERPPAEEVPPTFRGARGLACADAVREYRRDLRTWTNDRELTASERAAVETLGEHVKRVRMLDGDVEARTAEALIEATRDLANGLRGDELAFAQAQDRLEGFDVTDSA
jgi:hypothetical protein